MTVEHTESSATALAELPQGYYLANFCELVERVLATYADLLSPAEQAFYPRFQQLPLAARYLYVRMLMRKGDCFRAERLRYTEIPDREAAAGALAEADLIEVAPALAVEAWLPLLTKPEWLRWLAGRGIDAAQLRALKAARRAQLEEFLLPQLAAPGALQAPPARCYRLRDPHLFELFKLLYFGNPRQDLTEFILRDLQLTRYERYALGRATRRFSERCQIDRHLAFYRSLDGLESVLAADADSIRRFAAALPPADPGDVRLQRKRERVVLSLARQLERLQAPQAALALYRDCNSHPARERQARILAAAGRATQALDLCERISGAPEHEEEYWFAQGFGARLAKKHALQPRRAFEPPRYDPPQEELRLAPLAPGERVEQRVASYFGDDGSCHYVENHLLLGLFGLFYWEVLFTPVAGAFTHPFQYRPHDLYEADFRALRQPLLARVEAPLQRASAGGGYLPAAPLLQRFADKYGLANNLVAWSLLSPELLQRALERIPARHLAALFERLWGDLRAHRNGLPDLIHFPARGGYRLLEVKAPGDRLQNNQRRWMHWFRRHAIDHRVVAVKWEPDLA